MEKRTYSRIETEIYGTLYKDGIEVPIIICNMSENGIGLRYKYINCPAEFRIRKGDKFTLSFFDQTDFLKHKETIQLCNFKVVQTRRHTTHTYIGGKLTETSSNYSEYVLEKKTEKFVGAARCIGQNFIPQREVAGL